MRIMGYRLTIRCECEGKKTIVEFPKFFGYISTEDLIKTRSWQFLVSKGFVNDEDAEIFEYDGSPSIPPLSAEDFRTFITLYNTDLNTYEHDTGRFIWAKHYGGYYFCDEFLLAEEVFDFSSGPDGLIRRKLNWHDFYWNNCPKTISWE